MKLNLTRNVVRKGLFLFVTGVLLTLSAVGQLPTAQQVASQLKVGWNLGNTLEAICGETAWGNPAATQTLINAVKAAGFNTIRLPVAWDCHSSSNVIDAAWLARVKEVVDYCMNANMYVIINIHWDNGWLENNVTTSAQASVNEKQQAYWTQIANYFKAYDQRVLFASANEPNVEDATGMSVLLSYHQTFINAVRATGGNNSSRTLVIQGPSTDITKTNDLMNTLPTDQIANRLMVEVHYYTPWNFCGLTTDEWWGSMFYYWGNGYHSTIEPSRNATWGEESEVENYFGLMKSKFVDNGIPVILGEYGAIKRSNPADMAMHLASRQYYNKYITGSAISKGMIPYYWDNGASDFAIFNRSTGAVTDQGLLDAIMEGAGGNPEQDYTLTVNITGSGSVTRNPTGTTYPGGTSVTLTANAAAGYDFAGWSGDLSGTSNPATIVMSANKTVTANFIPEGTGGTGTILREYWTGISGTAISDLTSNSNYPNNPTGSGEITSLEGPVNWADNYGTRIRGYIHPPVTGSYTLWIAGDDYTNLYLSTSDNPANATRIAYVEGWTNSREWTKYTSQQSSAVTLTAGQKYYIEVLHKEGSGGDNVAVAWQGPGITQAVIAGSYLSPYSTGTGNQAPNAVATASPTSGSAPLNVSFNASGSSDPNGDALTFNWTFGDGATGSGATPSHTYSSTGNYTATVTVSDGSLTDQASVNISVTSGTVPVTGVTVSPTSGSITAGQTLRLSAAVSPSNATNKTVTWSSSNTGTATVNSSGLVTGVAAGTAAITVTTQDGGFTANSSITVTSSGTLPAPWATGDIGSVGAAGSASYSSGTFTVAGSGADIWGTADEFRYVYQPVSGDVEIIARVASLTNTDSWAKAGVMVRQSLTTGSIHAMTVVTPGNGTAFQRRTSANGSSSHTSGPSATAPYWVRLVKSGSTITSYASSNGSSWTQIGSISLSLSGTFYVGLAVTSHSDGTLCTASITNVTINTGTGTVPVTGVSVTPTSISLSPGGTQQLTATVSPSNATNKTVTWTTSNSSVATVSSTGLVSAVANGTATITVATQDGGFTATSAVTVSTATVPVTGVSVSPTSASLNPGGTQQLTATVSPANATNKTVTWTSSSTSVATVSSSGLVSGVAAGSATITVTTLDGGFTATCQVTITGTGGGCSNPVTISIPFVQNGPGDYCWFTSTAIAYINSWALEELTINGVDYTNIWSNSLPAAQNGGWTIHYVGNYGWSHFEAPQAKESMSEITSTGNRVELYPNPFTESVNLFIENPETINRIAVLDQLGRNVCYFDHSKIENFMELGHNLEAGMYIVQVYDRNGIQSFMVSKK